MCYHIDVDFCKILVEFIDLWVLRGEKLMFYNLKKKNLLTFALTLGLALGTAWHTPCSAEVIVDQEYDPYSPNAVSGVAMAGVIGDMQQFAYMPNVSRSGLADVPMAIGGLDDDLGVGDVPYIPNANDLVSVIGNLDMAIGDQSLFQQMNYLKEATSVALAACYLDQQVKANEDAIAANANDIKDNADAISTLKKDVADETARAKNAEEELGKRIDGLEVGSDFVNAKLDKLGDRIEKVGANAAALAALHPMPTDDGDKLSVAIGGGTYRDKYATALGLFYRPSDRVMLSLAGSTGSGESMANVGLSFALDREVKGMPSRKALNAQVKELKAENAVQAEQIKMLIERIEALEAKK